MQIEIYCPRWGSEDISWEQFCKKVKDAGYDGVEYAIPRAVTMQELDEAFNTIHRHNLQIIPQHFDTYETDFSWHFDLFNGWLEFIKNYPCKKINSQTGKDFFSFDQNSKLIQAADESGLNIVHETHRNKFSFAAHITKQYLQKIPSLKITLDASHWVCVSESYLESQVETMALAISRTDHIHARVGYPQGPQVPDPRIFEWREALNKHLSWWDKVAQQKRSTNSSLTITTEFGPFPYMIHSPLTCQPLSNQWDINVWMKELIRKRYL